MCVSLCVLCVCCVGVLSLPHTYVNSERKHSNDDNQHQKTTAVILFPSKRRGFSECQEKEIEWVFEKGECCVHTQNTDTER